ncbi:MAG: hypothetical protein ACP5OM_04935, partial [Methanothrix sp.]
KTYIKRPFIYQSKSEYICQTSESPPNLSSPAISSVPSGRESIPDCTIRLESLFKALWQELHMLH